MVKQLYEKSEKIVCRTPAIPHLHVSFGKTSLLPFSVFVETNVRGQASYSSFNKSRQFVFNYVLPQVASIEPLRGIKSGGTVLKVAGKHLHCGSSVHLLISGRPCAIIDKKRSGQLDEIYCQAPAFNQSSGLVILIMYDYVQLLDEPTFRYEYVDDAKMSMSEPNRTTMSGGVQLTINGVNFDHLQRAELAMRPLLAFYASAS